MCGLPAGVGGGLLGAGLLVNRAELVASVARAHEDWVIREHLPERLAVPGFLRGRRYVADLPDEPGAVRYATMYETTDVAVLASAPYLARLNRPSPLTRALTGASRAGRRTAARVLDSRGAGTGAVLVLVAYAQPGRDADVPRAVLRERLLPLLLGQRAVLSVHVGESDDAVTTAKDATCEAALAPGRSQVGEWLLLVELFDPAGEQSVLAALDDVARRHPALRPASAQSYRLQVSMAAAQA